MSNKAFPSPPRNPATSLPNYSFITQNITEPKTAILVGKIKWNFVLLDGLKIFVPPPEDKGVSFSAHGPDRLWAPPSLLCGGYRLIFRRV